MPDEPSDRRGEIGVERLPPAQTREIRPSLVSVAEKWLDRTTGETASGQPGARTGDGHYYVIQTNMGRELRAQFEVPQETPNELRTLLIQLDEK
jgi:hypothetical protein